jgi:hypothetical protein
MLARRLSHQPFGAIPHNGLAYPSADRKAETTSIQAVGYHAQH